MLGTSFTKSNVSGYTPLPSLGVPYKERYYGEGDVRAKSSYGSGTRGSYGSSYSQPRTSSTSIASIFDDTKYAGMNLPGNNPYKTIDNYKFRLGEANQEVPNRKGDGLGNVLMSVLDIMQRPLYTVTGALDELTDPSKAGNRNVGQAALEGFKGERRKYFTDIFENAGWYADPNKKWYEGSNLFRNALGFVGDVVFDPAVYFTGGSMAFAKGFGTKVAGKRFQKELSDILISNTPQLAKMTPLKMSESISVKSGGVISAEAIEKNLAKHEGSDVLRQLLYVVSESPTERTNEAIQRVLERGMQGFNADDVTRLFLEPLKKERSKAFAAGSIDEFKKFNRRFNSAWGNQVTKMGNKELFFKDKGARLASSKQLADALLDYPSKAPLKHFTALEKQEFLTNLYGHVGGKSANAIKRMSEKMTHAEFDILQILSNVYDFRTTAGANRLVAMPKELLEKAASPKPGMESFLTMSQKASDIASAPANLRRIEGGIEFGNGLQQIFRGADRHFFINYHNPFTGKVVPLIDISNVAKSEVARDAWRVIAQVNPLAPIFSRGGKVIGKVGSEINRLVGSRPIPKAALRRMEVAEGLRKGELVQGASDLETLVTTTKRQETAAAGFAAETTMAFKGLKLFKDNPTFRQHASIFVERDLSPASKALYHVLRGETSTSISVKGVDDEIFQLIEAFEKMIADGTTESGRLLRVLREDYVKLDDATKKQWDTELIEFKERNGMVNLALYESDKNLNIKWDRVSKRLASADSDPYAPLGDFSQYIHHMYPGLREHTPRLLDETTNPTAYSKATQDVLEGTTYGTEKAVTDPRAKATSVTTGAFKKREYDTAADFILGNPDVATQLDSAVLVSKRAFDSELVALTKNFIQEVNDEITYNPGLRRLVKNITGMSDQEIKKISPLGYKRVDLMDGNVSFLVHPEVESQFSRMATVWNPAESSGEIFQYFVSVQNMIKTLQTTYNINFIGRNAIGEPAMNWMRGVSIKSSKMAGDILNANASIYKIGDTTFGVDPTTSAPVKLYREYIDKDTAERTLKYGFDDSKKYSDMFDKEGKFLPQKSSTVIGSNVNLHKTKHNLVKDVLPDTKVYTLNGIDYTGRELLDLFYQEGLGWSGITKANVDVGLSSVLDDKMLAQEYKPGSDKRLRRQAHQTMAKGGEVVEEWTRLSHFIHNLDEGMDIRTASADVRKYHVDYRDLTAFESKYMRNLMPFYTYMRKNTEIQVKLMAQRLNKMHMVGSFVDVMYHTVEQDNQGQPLAVQDYLKEGLAVPLDVNDKGEVTFLNWGIPITDVGRLKYNLQEFTMENFYMMWSPMVKNPTEYALGQSMMSGKGIEPYEGAGRQLLQGVEGSPTIPAGVDQAIGSLGVIQSLRKGTAYAISDHQQGGDSSTGRLLKELLLGSLLPTRDQDAVNLQQAYDYKDQLYAHIKNLERDGEYVPPYSAAAKYRLPHANPGASLQQARTAGQVGMYGVPDSQLFPLLQSILSGR